MPSIIQILSESVKEEMTCTDMQEASLSSWALLVHVSCSCTSGSGMQGELGSKDDTVKELRRWLDQAQGQLQNTQTALHEREADCKTLSLDLKAALADLQAFKVSPSLALQAGICLHGCVNITEASLLMHVRWSASANCLTDGGLSFAARMSLMQQPCNSIDCIYCGPYQA